MLKKMIVFICLVVCPGQWGGAADQNVLRYVMI